MYGCASFLRPIFGYIYLYAILCLRVSLCLSVCGLISILFFKFNSFFFLLSFISASSASRDGIAVLSTFGFDTRKCLWIDLFEDPGPFGEGRVTCWGFMAIFVGIREGRVGGVALVWGAAVGRI